MMNEKKTRITKHTNTPKEKDLIYDIKECIEEIREYFLKNNYNLNVTIEPNKIIKDTMPLNDAIEIKMKTIKKLVRKLNGEDKFLNAGLKIMEHIEKRFPRLTGLTNRCKTDKKLKGFFFLADKKYNLTQKIVTDPIVSGIQILIKNITITLANTRMKNITETLNDTISTKTFRRI